MKPGTPVIWPRLSTARDGSVLVVQGVACTRWVLHNAKIEMMEHVVGALEDRDFRFRFYKDPLGKGFKGAGTVANLVLSGRTQILRFLGSIRPHRLLEKFDPERVGVFQQGSHKGEYREAPGVVAKRFLGKREVVALQTSSRTYIAEGVAAHNCVFGPSYTQDWFGIVSWGAWYYMMLGFSNAYADECYVAIPTDWIGTSGKAPNGFDIAKLEAALAADVAVKPQAVPEKLTVGA